MYVGCERATSGIKLVEIPPDAIYIYTIRLTFFQLALAFDKVTYNHV